MTSADTISAGELHRDRPSHLGRQIDTPHGWRVIRDIRRAPEPSAAVIIELATNSNTFEGLAVWPEQELNVREDGLERGNCFGVYTDGQVVETHRLREHAHLGLIDREAGTSCVVVVCPEHPYYLAEECHECGAESLAAVLAAENRVNDDLLDEERRTCRYCEVWALSDDHFSSSRHLAAIERLVARARWPRTLPRAA